MINEYGTLLLELQGLKEKRKKFINWLNDRIECEMRQGTKVKGDTVEVSESNDMNIYLEVLNKYIKIFDLEVERK